MNAAGDCLRRFLLWTFTSEERAMYGDEDDEKPDNGGEEQEPETNGDDKGDEEQKAPE